ncbi:MAG: hypothetical protein JO247_08910 [Chloroflexi bacterium]|nr:hypothetical protein [Chloroflexota bacterium]
MTPVANAWQAPAFVPSGAKGIAGLTAGFTSIVEGLDALITRLGRTTETTVLRFPPVIPRWIVDKAGYQHSFPQLLGTVTALPIERQEEVGRLADVEDWDRYYAASDAVLAPAACYPVYATAASAIPAGGLLVDVLSYCYRHEPSDEPSRLRSFRMREFVRVGSPEQCQDFHARMIAFSGDVLQRVGLKPSLEPASDPFFGRAARLMKVSQKEQQLKFEQVAPITADLNAAISSINYHREHFGEAFNLHLANGEHSHSACVGFGLERIGLALLWQHGDDPASWPAAVREQLWP